MACAVQMPQGRQELTPRGSEVAGVCAEPAERGRGGKLCLGVSEQDSGEQSREGMGIEEQSREGVGIAGDSGTGGPQRGELAVGRTPACHC